MKEIAYVGDSKSWEDVDKSIEVMIETNRMHNALIRDTTTDRKFVRKDGWIDRFRNRFIIFSKK